MKSAKLNDATILLARIADDNRAVLLEFYRTVHVRVYAFALKQLNDSSDAADVLIKIMLDVWHQASRVGSRILSTHQ